MSDAPAVRTDEVWKVFEHDGIAVEAVRGVSLEIGAGEFVVLAGPSGSGKTTLLNLIGGLTRPTRGRIWIDGSNISQLSERQLATLRLARVGFVFQAYNLLPVLTALENAEFTLLLRGMPEDERRRTVEALFAELGISGLESRRPGKLSGGQQQRVAVARAVAGEPALVLADEPTANLDTATSEALIDLMAQLNRDHGTTFVFATHDTRLMRRARRLIRLVDGAVAEDETRSSESLSLRTSSSGPSEPASSAGASPTGSADPD
jgi:putative ABC transport system ATP-binding protein